MSTRSRPKELVLMPYSATWMFGAIGTVIVAWMLLIAGR